MLGRPGVDGRLEEQAGGALEGGDRLGAGERARGVVADGERGERAQGQRREQQGCFADAGAAAQLLGGS